MEHKPPVPPLESERLAALKKLAILDTQPEERFDRLTRLAQHVLGVPLALISLVDVNRQWFKSRQGFDLQETPLDTSFCAHAIRQQGMFEVVNARFDPRFEANPLVMGPTHIRFYAGVPLRTQEGHQVGTLCIMDTRPRKLTSEERIALNDLAACVEDELNRITLMQQSRQLRLAHMLAETIGRAQSAFIQETHRPKAFKTLLEDILTLTDSEHGFISTGPNAADDAGHRVSFAVSKAPGDMSVETIPVFEEIQGLDLEALFGDTMPGGEPVLINIPLHQADPAKLPEGHLRISAFMGLPIHHGDELVAMLGVANRPGGYHQDMLDFLRPLVVTIGQLLMAARTKNAHKISERRLRATLEGTGTATWEWNIQTGETVFNERWADILGYSLSELEPTTIHTWADLLHPADLKHAKALHALHFAGKLNYFDAQMRMRHRAGHWLWTHGRGRVVSWTDDGKPLLMLGTYADISRHKETELALIDQARRTSTILETIVDGIITFDEQGVIASFNPAAEHIFGIRAKQVAGWNVVRLMPNHHLACAASSRDRLPAACSSCSNGIGHETEGRRGDGDVFPMELTVSAITQEGRVMYVAMVRDITERKRIERMKREFVSTVSHELRTPLTSIAGSLALVMGGAAGQLAEPAQEMIAIAHKNSQRLTYLINDLLDMEKLEAGKIAFNMQPQALMPLVTQALESDRNYGTALNVSLRLTSEAPDADVRVDGERLSQVLSNLLSNAIKFSPENGTVEIAVEAGQAWVRVTVTDHGPGIAHEFHTRIFQKFAQADSSDSRSKGGTGLGLAITKEMLEQMGGRIGFDSTLGLGASFYFELPLCNPQVPGRQTPDSLPSADSTPLAPPPHILIVEDEPDIARLMALILAQAGYGTSIAATGAQAMEALKQFPFAAMTLDLLLPDTNGLDLIRQIQQQPHTARLPIVVVSARMEEERLAINDAYFDIEWLTKPIDQNGLVATVQRLIASNSRRRPRVLHVEDDTDLHQVIRTLAVGRLDIRLANTLQAARAEMAQRDFDVIILDISLPDGSGWKFLPEIAAQQPDARVVILSGDDAGPEEDAHMVESVLIKSRVSMPQLLSAITGDAHHPHPD